MSERSEASRLDRLVMCLEEAADSDTLSLVAARGYLTDVAEFLGDISSGKVCHDCTQKGVAYNAQEESTCANCVFWNAGMRDQYKDT